MSRIVGTLTIEGQEFHITKSEPHYGTGWGWCLPGIGARGCTGYDTPGQALDAALEFLGITVGA